MYVVYFFIYNVFLLCHKEQSFDFDNISIMLSKEIIYVLFFDYALIYVLFFHL